MRVLFLTDSLSDLDGVGRYTVRLIRALEEERPGLQVEILLARKHRPTSKDVPAHWNVSVALPPDYFYYMSPLRFWASFVGAAWRVRARAKHADLVHAIKDYPHAFAGLYGAQSAVKPCIATAHGTYSVQPLMSKRHERFARYTYRRLAALIAVSNYTRMRLRELLTEDELPEARLHVVANSVSFDHYQVRRAVGTRPWHAHPYTLAIGEVKERKGHHVSLAAFCHLAKRFPDVHHYIVGNAVGDEYHQGLVDRAARDGLEDRVHFLGNVDEDVKVDLLQRARVFLHTPVTAADGGFEGFGIVYLEAAACGVPAIGTLDSGAEDAIDDGVSGFLVDQDVDAVEAALEKLLREPTVARAMGEMAREHARGSTWRDNAQRVLAIYDAALSQQR
ncbi:MAG: glycosyltransferase family 4 protein [Planctomycetota bacterium]|nr:glycosyltransferase family 4 protein [Planctomycetota bacterium]